jgi:hypothetical protein
MHRESPIDHHIGYPPIYPFQFINASSCHMKKCICLFISWENLSGISHDHSICPFIINLYICPFASLTLTFEANDIWVHISTDKIFFDWVYFEKSCLLKALKIIPFGPMAQSPLVYVLNTCLFCFVCDHTLTIFNHGAFHYTFGIAGEPLAKQCAWWSSHKFLTNKTKVIE